MSKEFYVYMMTNKKYGTIYTGVTSNLLQRIYQHKHEMADGFTKKYGCKMLVWYEHHPSAESAITTEKRMKDWQRQWKINRINEQNPHWEDLSIGLLG